MLQRGQAHRHAPRTLTGGWATPQILRAPSPRAPTPARAAARNPDKASPKEWDPTVATRFFNREPEIQYFNALFDAVPEEITLLVGPKDCGKSVSGPAAAGAYRSSPPLRMRAFSPACPFTPSVRMQALALEILGRRAALRATQAEGRPPVLYVDCRAHHPSTPEGLAKHMAERVTGNPSVMDQAKRILQTAEFSVALGDMPATTFLKQMFAPDPDLTPVESFIASYTKFLALFKRCKPIIYIDEANVLQAWREAGVGRPQLEALLRFFVKITKQDRLAHVGRATSPYLLESWLRKRRSEEQTSELQSHHDLVCRLLLAKKNKLKQFIHVPCSI